ncbi:MULTISPECIES: acyl-CoA dehydrogenase family protein [Streptomyces]|uniref:acyl-CoA dehydrogenase family protein n=1 Tax=Streptomyces TaxID=1883 RepID=UPI000D51A499|nr:MULTISPECIES: acyl-CoA dehydrogenase family protein [Streptomyces]MXG29027.1 acyl-CoA dehydrogenase [Streptomyces sp. YIM 132580]NYS17861.1 acyl-CoA dehydrogenase [Streptomyces sp. SJ1-7]PVC77984.1 acyl-CoA dehydrogenase [Streptomyces sp. CS065A]
MRNRDADQQALCAGMAQWGKILSEGHIEADARSAFEPGRWRSLAESGVLGLPFPQQWGGAGQSLLTTLHVLETLGETCRESGLNFCATTSMASTGVPLTAFGSDALRERYLPGICSGELIGAHAITEPDSGSDAMAMTTRAERDGTHYVLTGGKAFVSNGPIADVFVVYARTRPEGGPLGTTAFLVDRDTPGLSVGGPTAKMGLRTAPLSTLHLDGCRIPADRVLGRSGGGLLVLDHVMKREILFGFTVQLGEMRHRLERTVAYARERRAFGHPIGDYQAVSHRVVDMKIRTETAAKWLYDTAERLAAGEDVTADLAMTKILASEAALATSLSAVRVFGGAGYLTEVGLEKEVRAAVAGTLYSGTNDIQYNHVASTLGLGG